MKEIWKLLELLNEFEEYNKNCEFDEVYNYYPYRVWYEWDFETDLTKNCMNIVFIMSKTFWFIKWLVENNKIEFELDRIIHKHKWIDFNTWKWIAVEKLCDKYESLLMLLSISDTPIEDLILYLK